MKDEIKDLQKELIAKAEKLRLQLGAFAVKIEIEPDCDHENRCEITINIA